MAAKLSFNARQVLEQRYLWRDEKGRIVETPDALFRRVARAVAQAEKQGRAKWTKRFYDLMVSGRFLPNTPTLLNAGRDGQLSACYVLPVEDSLPAIFETLKNAAIIHQSGGGTGFSFSRLRPKNSLVHTTGGRASGPVSFIKIYDVATETIKQGGARRGANMAVLHVDHPDILDFIDVKRDQRSLSNFNISVAVTDAFMKAVERSEERAAFIFNRLVQAAWECGDPGVLFIDRMNEFNPTPNEGEFESTNPCGEQPLLPYESCNLGSMNVAKYFSRGRFDWETFKKDVRAAVRFLDNVIDVNVYPIPACERITKRNRKIGLGVMGLADLFLKMGIPYGSAESLETGEGVMRVLDEEAKQASAGLARERGAFPNFSKSRWKKLGFPPLRNATVSTVAPTGTISMIAGASSGIEPLFSGMFVRNILEGQRLKEIPAVLEGLARKRGLDLAALDPGEVDRRLSEVLGEVWSPANHVSIEAHVLMQAAFQRHCDAAVSKTINLPEAATRDDVARAYWLAYRHGCKGITVFRDRSRASQVLCSTC